MDATSLFVVRHRRSYRYSFYVVRSYRMTMPLNETGCHAVQRAPSRPLWSFEFSI